MKENGLPRHWVVKRIGEIRKDAGKSIDPSKSPDETFELYSVPSFETRQPESVRGAEIGSSKKTVEPDTVLFCKINPRINRVWRVHEANGLRQIASTEWIQFAPVEGIEPEYLRLFLSRREVRDYAASNVSGVGGSLMRIRATVLDQLEIPVPPLDEQKQIVAEIETHLARLDDAVAALQRARTRLKRYRASVLNAACEGRLVPTEAELAQQEGRDYEPASVLLDRIRAEREANGSGKRRKSKKVTPLDTSNLPKLREGWRWAAFGDLVARSEYGTSTKCTYENDGLPVLRIPNMIGGSIDLADVKFASSDQVLDHGEELRVGDMLVCRTNGSVDLVGRSALVREPLPTRYWFASYLLRFRFIESDIFPRWLNYYFWSNPARTWIEQHAASSAGQNNVSLSLLNTMPIPVPPQEEQRRIISEIDRRISTVTDMESTVETNCRRAEALRQSILRAAFSGQLVQQGHGVGNDGQTLAVR